MIRNNTRFALCITLALHAGAASATVDRAQLEACLRPADDAAGIAACDRVLASGGLTSGETVQAISSRAVSRAQSGATDQAIAEMDALVARYPGHAGAEGTRAFMLYSLERWPQAEASARRAQSLDSALPLPYVVLAQLAARRGDRAQALVDFEKAAARGPHVPVAQNGYCWALATANRNLDKALAACDRAIALLPIAGFLDSRGFVHFRMGNHAAAIKDYDAALAREDVPESYFGRGLAKLALGQESAGRADLATAKRLDPKIAVQFTTWGIGVPVGAEDPAPAASAAPAATAAPAAPAATSAAAPSPRAAIALARSEADYARQRARLRAAELRHEQAEDDDRISDAQYDRLEETVWDEQDRLNAARERLLAVGGHPELVPEPGTPLATPQPGSPAALRIAAARARYMRADETFQAAAQQANYSQSVGWMTDAQRAQYSADRDKALAEVKAAKDAFFAALAAAR